MIQSRSWAARGARRQILFVGVSSLCFIALPMRYRCLYVMSHTDASVSCRMSPNSRSSILPDQNHDRAEIFCTINYQLPKGNTAGLALTLFYMIHRVGWVCKRDYTHELMCVNLTQACKGLKCINNSCVFNNFQVAPSR